MSSKIIPCCQNGWAILIILIVAGVLVWYGIFKPSVFSNGEEYPFDLKFKQGETTFLCNVTDDETLSCSANACVEYSKAMGTYLYCMEYTSETLIFKKVR